MVLEQWIVQGGVAADVRVFEAISRETAGEQPRYGALDAVVLVPVNELVPDPEQGAVAGALCVARPVEEDDVVAPAGLVYGLAVVVASGVGAREQHGIVGKPLAEIGHPSRATVADELLFDNVLDPGPGLRVREIHEYRGEAGDRDFVGFASLVLYQIAVSCGLLEEVAAVVLLLRDVVTDEGVNVGHKPDISLFQTLPERTPIGVVIPVQLPVPPKLGAEAGLPLPHPVLKPDGGDGRIERLELV